MQRLDNARVLMYSHDTFGLGHLRRCRTIAHALVEEFKGVQVLIISGSPIAGAFDFRARVDFVKIPSVIKLYNGEYTSIDRHIDLADTLAMRQSAIMHTADTFDPDILIVDKEPMGLKGELEPTLQMLSERGTWLVLGLREVMDAPHLLVSEWQPKNMLAKIEALYDEIWAYGPEDFWNPLHGLPVSEALLQRMFYTGYLRRSMPATTLVPIQPLGKDYILVTAGGGGDGAELMHQVLAAYEHDKELTHPLVLVLGPFMSSDDRDQLHARAQSLAQVTVIDFDNRPEALLDHAAAVVGMCGYNTFCEVVSFDKRALMVPRVHPREEQLIRARRAAELGLVDMLLPSDAEDPALLAAALRRLPARPKPSEAAGPISLDGLQVICQRVGILLESGPHVRLAVANT